MACRQVWLVKPMGKSYMQLKRIHIQVDYLHLMHILWSMTTVLKLSLERISFKCQKTANSSPLHPELSVLFNNSKTTLTEQRIIGEHCFGWLALEEKTHGEDKHRREIPLLKIAGRSRKKSASSAEANQLTPWRAEHQSRNVERVGSQHHPRALSTAHATSWRNRCNSSRASQAFRILVLAWTGKHLALLAITKNNKKISGIYFYKNGKHLRNGILRRTKLTSSASRHWPISIKLCTSNKSPRSASTKGMIGVQLRATSLSSNEVMPRYQWKSDEYN